MLRLTVGNGGPSNKVYGTTGRAEDLFVRISTSGGRASRLALKRNGEGHNLRRTDDKLRKLIDGLKVLVLDWVP